jgi:hypothetical protein
VLVGWDNFFTAEAGASASLAGLIFVGVSINITKILATPRLPRRATQALMVLLMVLVVSLLLLIPSQSLLEVGAEVLLVWIVGWTVNTRVDFLNFRETEKQYRRQYFLVALLDQLTLAFYLVSGIALVYYGENGVYLLVPATILCFIQSMMDAWVLLVEINR